MSSFSTAAPSCELLDRGDGHVHSATIHGSTEPGDKIDVLSLFTEWMEPEDMHLSSFSWPPAPSCGLLTNGQVFILGFQGRCCCARVAVETWFVVDEMWASRQSIFFA